MKLDTYNEAKKIRDNISHLKIKKLQVEHTKVREDDTDFTLLRQLAHDSICYSIDRLEKDFSNL